MFKNLPGFRDFYPEACSLRNSIFRNWRMSARRFGFQEYDAPVLEPLDLFREKSGEEIVNQLFYFSDRGGREVALRPEMTPSLARLVGAKANSLKRPVKWFSIGEQYRYERQQRGRLRAFYQYNADILGEAGPEAEIELIALLIHSLCGFGLDETDFVIRLSDRDLWLLYLRAMKLDEQGCAAVLSVIDKYGREPERTTLEKLQPHFGSGAGAFMARISALSGIRTLEDVRAFLFEADIDESGGEAIETRLAEWKILLNGLEAMGIRDFIEIDLSIVRGLAYYTGFVFEAFDREGLFRALAGGGRYNDLVEKLAGAPMPAVGFAVGDVVLQEMLESKKRLPAIAGFCDVFVVMSGGPEQRLALRDVQLMREAGYAVEYSLKKGAFGKQLKLASDSGARFALIYGSDEAERDAFKLRDLQAREEKEFPRQRLLPLLKEVFIAH